MNCFCNSNTKVWLHGARGVMFSKRRPSYTSKASPEHDKYGRFSGISVSQSVKRLCLLWGNFEQTG